MLSRLVCFILLTLTPLLVVQAELVQAEPAKVIFAGGCFWCMESDFQDVEGVSGVVSGFTGGNLKNPSYSGNHQGHYEAVEISYDPEVVSYGELLLRFWHAIDPFDNSGQFCDKGPSYRAAIFTANSAERELAVHTRDEVSAQFPGETVHTEILDASEFWPVEDGHQDYYLKNPVRYKYYRWGCGRDQRLKEIWGESAGH